MCGKLGHGESFCPIRLTMGAQESSIGWNISLRAVPNRNPQNTSRWLRDAPKDLIRADSSNTDQGNKVSHGFFIGPNLSHGKKRN